MGMSKKRRSSKTSRGTVDRSATVDVVTQLEFAYRNPGAAALGALIGGLVPWFGRTLAHGEVPEAWSAGDRGVALLALLVVAGCAAFSGLSVYKFGRAAFGDPRKALGFVLALEGVMIISRGATSVVALGALVLINAIANGAVIALSRDATRRKREADGRGAATRARNRAAASVARGISGFAAAPPAVETRQQKSPLAAEVEVPSRALVVPTWRRPFKDVIDVEASETQLLS
jgi:hypothetical protein